MKSAVQIHWDYFAFLEKDLITVSETLELCEENYDAFGPLITKIVLNAGSELDGALKSLARAISFTLPEQPTMSDFRKMLLKHKQQEFATATVRFLHTDIIITPWNSLSNEESTSAPNWWTSYNQVKHQRAQKYTLANLKTALSLIAALFTVIAYLRKITGDVSAWSTRIVD